MSNMGPSKELVDALVGTATGLALRWKKTVVVAGVVGATLLMMKKARGRRRQSDR